jgi:MoxR-like ATPase
VGEILLSDEVMDFVVDVVRATREDASLAFGASPRSSNMLAVAARALAVLSGRDYVIPDDVKSLAGPVLGHRVVLSPDAHVEGVSAMGVLKRILEKVPAPR